ncbi:MAG: hypothetical protein IT363_15720 [Methanoregulaceae archaeon]|jgi:hypothetical protein|nr:hypothetical protein [Methanoregulaceae archaeon]
MAKRKQPRRRSHRAFVGDRVLCLYLVLSCCCVPLWEQKPAGQEPEWPFNESLRKFLREILEQSNAELMFAVPAIGLIIGWFAVLIGLWRSRTWALWVMLTLNLPGTIYATWVHDWISAVLAGVIVVYCALRVSRLVG